MNHTSRLQVLFFAWNLNITFPFSISLNFWITFQSCMIQPTCVTVALNLSLAHCRMLRSIQTCDLWITSVIIAINYRFGFLIVSMTFCNFFGPSLGPVFCFLLFWGPELVFVLIFGSHIKVASAFYFALNLNRLFPSVNSNFWITLQSCECLCLPGT